MNDEQERAPRIDRKMRVEVMQRDQPTGGQSIPGELIDVSKTGIGLRTPVAIPVGTEMDVTVHLTRKADSGEDRITIPARVAGCIIVAGTGRYHIGAVIGKLSLHDAQVWHDTTQRWRSFVV